MAGFLHKCLEGGLHVGGSGINGDTHPQHLPDHLPDAVTDVLLLALRRGDLVAALSQETYGDLSGVSKGRLESTEAAWPLERGAADLATAAGAAGAAGVAGAAEVAEAAGVAEVVEVVVEVVEETEEKAATDAAMEAMEATEATEATETTSSTAEAAWVERMEAVACVLKQARIVPVVAVPEVDMAVPLALALKEGGLGVIELVFRTAAAAEALEAVVQAKIPGLLVGAGTVLTTEQCRRAVDAGADFIVAPGLNPEVVRYSKARGVPIIPGVCTPTEVEAAMAMGLTCLKFFPAQVSGGAPYLKAMSAPYPQIRWMPTGGVKEESVHEFLSLPSVLAAGGSWMVPKDALEGRDFPRITALARQATDVAQSI